MGSAARASFLPTPQLLFSPEHPDVHSALTMSGSRGQNRRKTALMEVTVESRETDEMEIKKHR